MQALNYRVSLHNSKIKLPEITENYVPIHLYKCSNGIFKIMPIYQTDDYSTLQIKEKTS